MRKDNDELPDIIWDFLDKYYQCEPHINGAIQIATIHSCPYTGPTLEKELKALEEAIGYVKG